MMKKYLVGGVQRQYEEGKQPEGATEVVDVKAEKDPDNKAKKPANKARKPKETK